MTQTAAATPNPVTLVANIATALLGGSRPLSRNPVANQIASTTLGIASFGLGPLAIALLDRPKKKNDPLKPIKDMERVIRKALAGNRPLTAKEQAYFLRAERGYAARRVGRFPEQDDVFGTADEKDLMQILLHHQTFGDYRARDVLRAVKPYSVKHRRSDKPQRQTLLPVSAENSIRRAQLFETIPPIAEPERGRRWNRDNANFQMKSERVIGRGRLRQMVPAVDVETVYKQFDAYDALFPEPVAPAPIVQPTPVAPVPIPKPEPIQRGNDMSITGINTSSWAQTIGTIGDALAGVTQAIAPAIPGIIQASTGRGGPVIIQGTQPGAVGGGLNPFGTAQPFVDSPVMPGGVRPVFAGEAIDSVQEALGMSQAPTTPFRETSSGNQVARPFVRMRDNGSAEWFIPAGKPKTWTKANVKRRRSCRPR